MAFSTGVCCSTPWPRLKMCPGRPAAWSRTSLARRRISATSASRTRGIEIALDRPVVADGPPGFVQPHTPVDADHAAAALGQQRQQRRIARGEIDHRHAGRDPGDDLLDVRQHVAAIVVRAQATDPRVEQLDALRPGGDLGVQVARDRAGQPLHQFAPGAAVAVHQRLGVQVVAAGSAFDHVAGQRERRAGKPDQRNAGPAGRGASAGPFP